MIKITVSKILFFIFPFCFSTLALHSQTASTPTGSDSTCIAGVSFYQRVYGGNKDEFGYFSAPSSDSGYVIAGKTKSFGNGGYDGLLMKVNKRGNVEWSKAFGGSGDDDLVEVKRTSDNGYIACGNTRSYGSIQGDAWLIKVDASGNLEWSKKYGDGNADGQLGFDVVQLSDGGYAFCGLYRWAGGGGGVSQSFVVRTDGQGNVIWSKQHSISGASDDAYGIMEDGNFLVVTGLYNGGSSYMDGYIMKLDKTNGAVQWIKRYDAEGRSTWFDKPAKTSTGYQVRSTITDNFSGQNQQLCIWNLNTDGTVQNVRKLVIPGIWNISVGWYPQDDGGFIVANGENSNNSDVILSKINANGTVEWSKKYPRAGRQHIYSIRPSVEGGYFILGNNNNAGTLADSSNVYMMRVDSSGNGGVCSGISTNDVTVVTPSYVSSTITSPQSDVVITNPVITIGAVNAAIVTNTLCNYCQLFTPVNPGTGSDTLCAAGVSFYQRVYGGNKDEFGYFSAPSSDSGYVIAGKTKSFGNGGYDGLLMKVNKRGNVEWSKAFGGSGDDDLVEVKRTSDNGYIACGNTRSYGSIQGDAWLIKVDASGNLEWSKKYGDGNADGQLGFDVVQLSDGGYAFCGLYRWAGGGGGVSQSFVVRTDGQGNVIWSKQHSISGASDDAYGIMEDGNFLVVTGLYNGGSSYMDGYIMKLDKTNGAVQWIKRYDAEGRSTWFDKPAKTSTGYQVRSTITDNFSGQNQQLCIWNLNTDGTVQNVRKLVIPGIWNISVGWYPQDDGGFIVANGENSNNSDVILSKINANGTVEWSKKYPRAGRQHIYSIRPSVEGGYFILGNNNNAGTLADSSNVYMMRVDSSGNGGVCSGISTNDVTVVTPSYVSSTITSPQSDVVITNPVITIGAVNAAIVTNTLCYYCQLQLPVAPPDTLCAAGVSFYQRVYGGNKDEFGYFSAPSSDSGYVIAGKTKSFGNGGYDGLLMKVNKRGNVEWSKAFGGSGDDDLVEVKRTSDNGYIACGNTRSYGSIQGDAWLIKVDASGNLEWSKKYGDGNADGQLGFDVVQLSDGGYAFCGLYRWAGGGGGVSQSFVVRTDGQGNVIWSKQHSISGASDDAYGIMEDGNFLVVTGLYNGGSSYMDGYIMKLDKTNGAVQWIKRYDAEGRSTWFDKPAKTSTGYQVRSTITDNFSGQNQQLCIWNLNTDGTVQNVRKLVIPGIWNISVGWYPQDDGGFIVANGENSNNSDVILSKINANGTVEWSKKYPRAGRQHIYSIRPSVEGGYFILGNNNNAGTLADSSNVYMMRVDSSGNGGVCSGISTNDVTVVTPSYVSSTITSPQSDVVITNPVITIGAVNAAIVTNTLCFYCQPLPTGIQRAMSSQVTQHVLRVYPNPVISGTINLSIEANYDDQAIISVVDIYGNTLISLAPKEIKKGQNLIQLNQLYRLRNFSNYFVVIQYKNYRNAAKIFFIK